MEKQGGKGKAGGKKSGGSREEKPKKKKICRGRGETAKKGIAEGVACRIRWGNRRRRKRKRRTEGGSAAADAGISQDHA